MTPYEIWRGKKPNMNHFHEFGSTCIVLNDREHMRKFDLRSDEGMFLKYSKQQSLQGVQQMIKHNYRINQCGRR